MTTNVICSEQIPVAATTPTGSAYRSCDANAEGWGIFDCGLLEDGTPHVELQRLDSPDDSKPPFPDDGAAWDHVVAQARQGKALHQAALRMVDKVERCLIEARCGWWPGCQL